MQPKDHGRQHQIYGVLWIQVRVSEAFRQFSFYEACGMRWFDVKNEGVRRTEKGLKSRNSKDITLKLVLSVNPVLFSCK